jgi:hypothetical protein
LKGNTEKKESKACLEGKYGRIRERTALRRNTEEYGKELP